MSSSYELSSRPITRPANSPASRDQPRGLPELTTATIQPNSRQKSPQKVCDLVRSSSPGSGNTTSNPNGRSAANGGIMANALLGKSPSTTSTTSVAILSSMRASTFGSVPGICSGQVIAATATVRASAATPVLGSLVAFDSVSVCVGNTTGSTCNCNGWSSSATAKNLSRSLLVLNGVPLQCVRVSPIFNDATSAGELASTAVISSPVLASSKRRPKKRRR